MERELIENLEERIFALEEVVFNKTEEQQSKTLRLEELKPNSIIFYDDKMLIKLKNIDDEVLCQE